MNFERKKIRLDKWDYSSDGIYFITICCQNRELFFGSIDNHKVIFSKIGQIASQFWLEIPSHFLHVKIDDFVIMPNHIHGILILDYSLVGTRDGVSLQENNRNKFSYPVKNSISVIINQYKSSVKRWCNKNGFNNFCWQSRFYDKIVHNESPLEEIRTYIINNPNNWTSDELYDQ
jgi:REP element-mobilizing transposase RayT